MKQKIISIFLCFVLLLSLFIMPFKANAYVGYDPASAALFSFFSASGIFSDFASATVQLISDTWHKIQVIAESQKPYFDLMNKLKAAQAGKKISFTKDELYYLQTTFKEIYLAPTFVGELYYEGNLITAENIDKIGYLAPQQEVYVPTQQAMQNIAAITQEQILFLGFETNVILESIDETLLAGNQITAQIQRDLMSLTGALRSEFARVYSIIETLYIKTEEMRLNLWKTQIDVLNKTEEMRLMLSSKLDTLWSKVEETRLNLVKHITNLYTKLEETRLSLSLRVDNLLQKLEDFRLGVLGRLDNLQASINQLVQVYNKELTVTFRTPEQVQLQEQLQLQLPQFENQLNDIVNGNVDKILILLNDGRDILGRYSNAFLAVSSVLLSFGLLPIFSDLISFSISLGCFALLVNLANMVLSSTHTGSGNGKSKASKTSKGG